MPLGVEQRRLRQLCKSPLNFLHIDHSCQVAELTPDTKLPSALSTSLAFLTLGILFRLLLPSLFPSCGTTCHSVFSLSNFLWAANVIRLLARAPFAGSWRGAFAFVLAELPNMLLGTLCALFLLKVAELFEIAHSLGYGYVPGLLYRDFRDDWGLYKLSSKSRV